MKEPDLEEEALRASARAGELTVERQTMADDERAGDRAHAVRRRPRP